MILINMRKIILVLSYLIFSQSSLLSNTFINHPLASFNPDPLPVIEYGEMELKVQELFGANLEIIYIVKSEASSLEIPLALIYSLIQKESNWNPRAVSPKNPNGSRDYGLMQLSSSNFDRFEIKYKPRQSYTSRNIYDNVEAGASYLKEMYDTFGSWNAAVAAYNCGPNRYKTGKIPESTKRYVDDIFSMIKLLEGES
jgi:soluble lytic murein transglycosylase-like protein